MFDRLKKAINVLRENPIKEEPIKETPIVSPRESIRELKEIKPETIEEQPIISEVKPSSNEGECNINVTKYKECNNNDTKPIVIPPKKVKTTKQIEKLRKLKAYKRLNSRQRQFVRNMTLYDGNACKSAREAGYNNPEGNASRMIRSNWYINVIREANLQITSKDVSRVIVEAMNANRKHEPDHNIRLKAVDTAMKLMGGIDNGDTTRQVGAGEGNSQGQGGYTLILQKNINVFSELGSKEPISSRGDNRGTVQPIHDEAIDRE